MPTLIHRLDRWANDAPSDPAQAFLSQGDWKIITAAQYRDRIFYLALFLESRGFGRDDTAAIFSYNCPEVVHLDFAPHLIGGKSFGIYPNTSSKDLQYILGLTGAKVIAVQNKSYFEKLGGVLPPTVKMILTFGQDTSFSELAVSYQTAIEEGKKLSQGKKIEDYLKRLEKKAGAFLIFTSGTTGHPKGAMLSHDNLVAAADVAIETWKIPVKDHGRMFSFLPLCHIAEKLQNECVGISGHYCVHFCSKFENLSVELPAVKPTVLLCVPRLWEKMMEGVQARLKNEMGLKKQMVDWAFKIGERYVRALYADEGFMISPLIALQYRFAEALVFKKIRARLGLSDCVRAGSGAAALSSHVVWWFRIIGIEIYEDFGQTESTGIICMTVPGRDCAGTVGKPVDGLEFKIADDGEICCKGRLVFVGYFNNEQATKETVVDGWLQTGDLAELDSRGYVKIKGRKKEIMKTSSGKMIAPSPIEEKIKVHELVSQVCIVGDGKKYFSALITLSASALKALGDQGELNGETVEQSAIRQTIKDHLDEVNLGLAGFEKIKYFTILSREFSVDEGEMTPTLKLKRNIVENHFQHLIEKMYP